MSNNWFNIPDKSVLTESNICDFCAADKDECGEYAECCYREARKEYENKCNIKVANQEFQRK